MAQYPTSAADDSNLYVAVNNKNTTLVGALTASGGNYSATEIEVSSTTGFPSSGLITIDTEVISYSGVATSPHRFTGITRGQDGSTAVSHINGASVIHTVVAAHHNVLKDEVKAIEADLITSRPKWFNYIANGAAANDTTGWATYADAAGVAPVDGSGGSPTVTWTRSTSSPLRGVASFVLTKDAANRQGEGVSYDFTIDAADKAKPLYVSFTYLPDTNYADDDIRVWLYDVTNAALIQPASYLLKDVLNAESWKGVFQTSSNSTSYRLIIHIGSTNASAYTVKFDDLRISPEYAVMGSPTTDWKAYTPTGGWNTNVTYTGFWRRVGDSMEIDAKIACSGAPNNATPTVSIPAGYAIDQTRLADGLTGQYMNGVARLLDSGTAYYEAEPFWNSTTAVGFRYLDGASNWTGMSNNTTPFVWASGDSLWVHFVIPIVGWSSSVLMSDNADTRVIAGRVSKITTAQTLANNTATKVTFNQIDSDTHGMWDAVNNRWVVPVAGYYRIDASLYWETNSANMRMIRIHVNGTNVSFGNQIGNAVDRVTTKSSTIQRMNAGDYVEVWGEQSSGGNLDIRAGATVDYFEISRLSGPSQIAATETVAARYTNAVSQNVPNSGQTIIDYATKVYDSHGAVTVGSSWKFTAPVSGLYHVSFMSWWGSTAWSVGNEYRMELWKNGSQDQKIFYGIAPTSTQRLSMNGDSSIRLLAGDYIDLRASQTSAGTQTIGADAQTSWITVTRIGNYV